MRGNPHVRFGPEAAGKGPAPCRHLAGVPPVLTYYVDTDFGPCFPPSASAMACQLQPCSRAFAT